MTHLETSPEQSQLPDPHVLLGTSGAEYTVSNRESFSDGKASLLDTVVHLPDGTEAYLATKSPEKQALVIGFGAYLAAHDPALQRLAFPQVTLDEINGRKVALVEFFGDHIDDPTTNPQHAKQLTDAERGFLGVFNTFIGNWDYKADHVLMPKNPDGKIGLIDFEMAFDFENPLRMQHAKQRLASMGALNTRAARHYCERFEQLNAADWQAFAQFGHQAGLPNTEVEEIMQTLQARIPSLRAELAEVYGGSLKVLPRRQKAARSLAKLISH